MRSFTLFSFTAIAAASSLSGQEHKVETINVPAAKEVAPAITVVDANRTYAVKFECTGCPFGILKNAHEAEWVHPPPDNSLMLTLAIDKSGSTLLLNDQRVFPLDSLPPHISAVQVPTNLSKDEVDWQGEKAIPERLRFPLQYEHTVFRAERNGEAWLQFNVTGLAWGEEAAPVKMGQKAVQVLLREYHVPQEVEGQQGYLHGLSIADVQIVGGKDLVQPSRMRCGRLAMIRTAFDPNEWDGYGKFGTLARTWNLIVGKLGDFWSGHMQNNTLLFPLTLLLVASIIVARRIYQFRQQENVGGVLAAVASWLGCHASPRYANIPVIKIEEYD